MKKKQLEQRKQNLLQRLLSLQDIYYNINECEDMISDFKFAFEISEMIADTRKQLKDTIKKINQTGQRSNFSFLPLCKNPNTWSV